MILSLLSLNCTCHVNPTNHNANNSNETMMSTIQVVDDNELLLNNATKPVIEIIGNTSRITFYP